MSPKTHSYIHDGRDHTKPNLSEWVCLYVCVCVYYYMMQVYPPIVWSSTNDPITSSHIMSPEEKKIERYVHTQFLLFLFKHICYIHPIDIKYGQYKTLLTYCSYCSGHCVTLCNIVCVLVPSMAICCTKKNKSILNVFGLTMLMMMMMMVMVMVANTINDDDDYHFGFVCYYCGRCTSIHIGI